MRLLTIGLTAAATLVGAITAASASPAGGLVALAPLSAAEQAGNGPAVEKVHWRRWHHRHHWRWGWRPRVFGYYYAPRPWWWRHRHWHRW